MKSYIKAVVLGGTMLLGVMPVRIKADDLSGTLKGIEDRYNSIKTLEVNFTESSKQGNRTITDKGTLFLHKPKKMLWRYSTPEGRMFVMDGKYVYDYSPGDKQVERVPFKETEDTRGPLAFLLGNLNFKDDFGKFNTAADGTITALPKSDKSAYTEVSFQVGPDFAIHKLIVKLQTGPVVEYRFDGEKKNPTLADSLFVFKAPAGVPIVQATK
jgi:outer membrane lipoprotein carrier protein